MKTYCTSVGTSIIVIGFVLKHYVHQHSLLMDSSQHFSCNFSCLKTSTPFSPLCSATLTFQTNHSPSTRLLCKASDVQPIMVQGLSGVKR